MTQNDTEGCLMGMALLIALAAVAVLVGVACCTHPSPESAAQRQQMDQRNRENAELAEWTRTQQLRAMREDKARAEQPK